MNKFENKFKVGDIVKIIRTGKIGKINDIDDHDFSNWGNSVRCYCVEFTDSDFSWYTVHDLKLVKKILDNKEREYLSNVIKPFKKDVASIVKKKNLNTGKNYICIKIKNDFNIFFPDLKNDNMYKKMELNKKYTLKELRIIGGSYDRESQK